MATQKPTSPLERASTADLLKSIRKDLKEKARETAATGSQAKKPKKLR
jgi:hypothetical protein